MKTRFAGLALALIICLAGPSSGFTRVESPNGGERIPAGGRWLITWQCDSDIEQVSIELSFTDGVFWEPVIPAAECSEGRGSYLWTVPSLSSPACLIRIADLDSPKDSDQSDGVFTIFPCALRMDYDNDCVITLADFAAFAEEWLRCGDPYDPACLGNRQPQITSNPVLQAATGQSYAYRVKAVDPDSDVLNYELLRAPAGMTIDSASGAIAWRPASNQSGAAPVIIQVGDPSGAADIQAFELNVSPLSPPAEAIFTGAPVDGYPNLFERRTLVYTNAMRMAPQQYRDKYMADFQPDASSILQTYSPVEPVYYQPLLNQAARFHAEDMAENDCFQHDDCDGSAWNDRIRGFYPEARMIAENIAYGYPSAKAVVDAWLCDETGGRCAADGTQAAGHRTSMVNDGYRQIGTGWAEDEGGAWRSFWVEDFASNEPASRPPIVAGCHDFLVSGKTSFLVNYRDVSDRAPAAVQVIVSGTTYDMSLDLGTQAAGTYRVDVSRAGNCREYYFLALTASGQLWRYPGPGVFLTDGEASCGEDYRSTEKGS
ncbi:MAG: hypothetical protein A2Z25_09415 [Planctomycetes bacterium RBG_16_55_9]|nr:MAG: hypothetical protein A2Z25_09415 [Planctomycetes bacterium RBG_16_55_9]